MDHEFPETFTTVAAAVAAAVLPLYVQPNYAALQLAGILIVYGQCSTRDDQGSAGHETRCSTGCGNHNILACGRTALNREGWRHHNSRHNNSVCKYQVLYIQQQKL